MLIRRPLPEAGCLLAEDCWCCWPHWKKPFWIEKSKVPPAAMLLALLSGLFTACSGKGPEPIALNKDNCDYCKMSISNMSFASEIVTVKGRAYKFDDLACLIHYKNDNFGKENRDMLHLRLYYTKPSDQVRLIVFLYAANGEKPYGRKHRGIHQSRQCCRFIQAGWMLYHSAGISYCGKNWLNRPRYFYLYVLP